MRSRFLGACATASRSFVCPCLLAAAAFMPAHAVEVIKVAVIDPLTGPFGAINQNVLNTFRISEEIARKQKGAAAYQLEFVPFDNKASAQETVLQLQNALNQGIRYVYQSVGAGPALPLLDAINKHNERNPGKEVLYLNWVGEPSFTNEKCSFWMFRLDQNTEMKAEAMTTYLAEDKAVKKVYLINPNYSTGQQFAKASVEYLKRKRPDIEVVGDDLHPLGQIKDFTPYITKMKAAGADTVLTIDFGVDLALLIKAGNQNGLNANWYTVFAANQGVPTAMGAAGAGRVKVVTYWHANTENPLGTPISDELRKSHNEEFVFMPAHSLVAMLHAGFAKAGSADPVKVAFAMEGLRFTGLSGELEMRASDHQIQQPMFVATWTKADGKTVKYDMEKTGYGWKPEKKLEAYAASQPTSCQMKRPAKP